MEFPETERVIFKKSPLKEVICQVRFPSILSIETEIPSKFQDRIRDEYPLFNEKVEVRFKITKDATVELPDFADIQPSHDRNKNYEFVSSDENWKINLTSGFLTLSTHAYTRWEEFALHFDNAYKALLEIYKPPFFTRIGLRYKDIISRSDLGFDGVPWSELLEPHILGILIAPNLNDGILQIQHVTEIALLDNCVVRIASGLLPNQDEGDSDFVIDSDFFTTSKTEIPQTLDKLDFFNTQGTRLIQWSTTKKLQDAMEPELI
jgi:uncharacterized protein (TIGR04255 family)